MKRNKKTLWWRVPLLLAAFLGVLFFIMPMTMRIVNIGNITILAVALLLGIVAVFFDQLSTLVRRWWKSKAGRGILSFLCAVLGLIVLTAGILSGYMAYAAAQAPTENAVAVVLGCKVNGSTPSLMLTKRLEAAKAYLDAHPDKVCIVSGGQGPGEDITEAQAMKTWLVDHGISANRILMEDESHDTEQNIAFSKRILMQNNMGTEIAIITDGFHELRASLLAKEQFLTPYSVPADTPWYVFPTYYVRELYALVEQLILK